MINSVENSPLWTGRYSDFEMTSRSGSKALPRSSIRGLAPALTQTPDWGCNVGPRRTSRVANLVRDGGIDAFSGAWHRFETGLDESLNSNQSRSTSEAVRSEA